ncbi:hypothetical protein [Pseudoalteromonas byunsanensis]|uniref:Uncharacterized protein n=1 Tax=Pseudoalteromonas byunsanensis TaxID=327939 RepID=A0A1S1NCF7_9GAMM|nr:hypothetical protein [Pseudoalteromonas byunsanensis]OHU97164.1 hypothetical protein BIW53_02260 [Pseudoalteromonas byunsanensis]
MDLDWFIFINIAIVFLWAIYLINKIYHTKAKASRLDLIDNSENVISLRASQHQQALEESSKLLMQSKYLSEFVFEGVSQETLLLLNASFRRERDASIAKLVRLGLLNPTHEKQKMLGKN